VETATRSFDSYDYMTAKNETEIFFWRDLADNYIEMAKRRLYAEDAPQHEGARFTLHHVLVTTLKLFAPILPFVTEQIYLGLFGDGSGVDSIHRTTWPTTQTQYIDAGAETIGHALVDIASAVRRFKSEHALSLGAELSTLHLHIREARLAEDLCKSEDDILSVTRAREIVHNPSAGQDVHRMRANDQVDLVIVR
jgi:valyl-tRNA synthetase